MKITVEPKLIDRDTFAIIETVEADDPIEKFARQVSEMRVDMRDKAIRGCLIAMGWTPPPGEV